MSINRNTCQHQLGSKLYEQMTKDCYATQVNNATVALTKGPGVAILSHVFDVEFVDELTKIIRSHDDYIQAAEFAAAAAAAATTTTTTTIAEKKAKDEKDAFITLPSLNTPTRRPTTPPIVPPRYLSPFGPLVGGAVPVPPWDEKFLLLMCHPLILAVIDKVLGNDALLDNGALSVAWPQNAIFGPHLDRPFDRPSDVPPRNWPAYSSSIDNLPPKEYPISLQVIVALDDFTASNGAFYYMLPTDNVDNLQYVLSYPHFEHHHELPEHTKSVFIPKGSVIIASGHLPHGADRNRSKEPRIAVLIQYVRRYVRTAYNWKKSLDVSEVEFLPPRIRSLLDLY